MFRIGINLAALDFLLSNNSS